MLCAFSEGKGDACSTVLRVVFGLERAGVCWEYVWFSPDMTGYE